MTWRCSFVATTTASGRKFFCNRLITFSVNTSKFRLCTVHKRFNITFDSINDRYEKAAKLYAQTEASFEEVALKFMEIKQEDALQAFLLEVRTYRGNSSLL